MQFHFAHDVQQVSFYVFRRNQKVAVGDNELLMANWHG